MGLQQTSIPFPPGGLSSCSGTEVTMEIQLGGRGAWPARGGGVSGGACLWPFTENVQDMQLMGLRPSLVIAFLPRWHLEST